MQVRNVEAKRPLSLEHGKLFWITYSLWTIFGDTDTCDTHICKIAPRNNIYFIFFLWFNYFVEWWITDIPSSPQCIDSQKSWNTKINNSRPLEVESSVWRLTEIFNWTKQFYWVIQYAVCLLRVMCVCVYARK